MEWFDRLRVCVVSELLKFVSYFGRNVASFGRLSLQLTWRVQGLQVVVICLLLHVFYLAEGIITTFEHGGSSFVDLHTQMNHRILFAVLFRTHTVLGRIAFFINVKTLSGDSQFFKLLFFCLQQGFVVLDKGVSLNNLLHCRTDVKFSSVQQDRIAFFLFLKGVAELHHDRLFGNKPAIC